MRRVLLCIVLFFCLNSTYSQAKIDTARLFSLVDKGMKMYQRKSYDSALVPLLSAYDLIKKQNAFSQITASIALNAIGDTYLRKSDYTKAHQFYTEAINTARKYGWGSEKQYAYFSLLELHRIIIVKDTTFNYPVVSATEGEELFIPFTNFQQKGDSIDITLEVGRYDGIEDLTRAVDIYTHVTSDDTIGHNSVSSYGTARIVEVKNNRTLLRLRKDPDVNLLSGDLALIKAQVPISWRNLSLRNFLLRGMIMNDGYGQRLFHRRYYYYYADSTLEAESMEMMYQTIRETAESFAEDTATNEMLSRPSKSGIFAGSNVIKGMLGTRSAHIRMFLNFVDKYPGKYLGVKYKFPEIYGTWIINNTPIVGDDIKPWLLNITDPFTRRTQIVNLRDQIEEENLVEKWVDEGLQHVSAENLRDAGKTSQLIGDYIAATGDKKASGWCEYLDAMVQKNLGNTGKAQELLAAAEQRFDQQGNPEGVTWVRSIKAQWNINSNVEVRVQEGHLFPFVIAQSPNHRYFATGGVERQIKIWDRQLYREILTLNDHTDEVNSLEYSSDGRYLMSASDDSTIRIWNAYTYTLVYTHKVDGPVRIARFSYDNKYIATAEGDSLVRLRDMKTGKVVKTLAKHKGMVQGVCFHPVLHDVLFSCGSDSLVYRWNLLTENWNHWYKHKGKVISVKVSNDGKFMSAVSTDTLLTVWNVDLDEKYMIGKIGVHRLGQNLTYFGGESFSPDSKYIAYPYKKDSFVVIDLHRFYQWGYPTQLPNSVLADLEYGRDGTSLFGRFEGGPLRIYNIANYDIRSNTTITSRDINFFANLATTAQFTSDGTGLGIIHSEMGLLDLRNGSYKRLAWAATPPGETRDFMMNDGRRICWFSAQENSFYLFDHVTNANKNTFKIPQGDSVSTFTISQDNKYFFAGTRQGRFLAWKTDTDSLVISTDVASSIEFICYDPYHLAAWLATKDDRVLLVNLRDGLVSGSINIANLNYLACSPTTIFVTTDDGWLLKFDAKTLQQTGRMRINDKGEPAYYAGLSNNNNCLLIQNTLSTIMCIRTSDDSILYTIRDHPIGGTIGISPDGKMFATTGFDSRVNLFEIVSGKKIASVLMPMGRSPVIVDDAGHFLAARNSLDAILFTYNNKAYGFDQFDLQLNRPDIILDKIGKADKPLLKTYNAAWKKRLDRLSIDEKDVNTEIHLPQVRLQDRFALQQSTRRDEYEFTLECSDSRYPLQSLQVLVNNSPALSISGRDLRALNTRETQQVVRVKLSQGNNNIKIYCTNSKGVRSLKESFDIIANYKPAAKAKCYFIGIGVAHYKDSKMNLTYSAKDIRDLAGIFKSYYRNIEIDTLIDKAVTRESILALKKKLQQTTVNDRVVLAVTGHGLLSDSLDFYYATWDVNFDKPENRGLKYEDLENLLTDIPAREKLMLIDACHSGALDKSELLASRKDSIITVDTSVNGNIKGIAPRGFGLGRSKLSANSSFELMQNLFTDLSTSNGAVIISAAGGMEFAFESPTWSNGVFTYSVRRAMETDDADKLGNNDERVSVRELMEFVSQKVVELTAGKQRPTSRRENIDFDWPIR